MEKEMQTDYQQWDRVWQRVAPELNPYPEARQAMAPRRSDPPEQSCGMANHAALDMEALCGFIEEELDGRRTYLAYAGCAPNASAKRVLRQLAAEETGHARRLMSVYYILTGECYQPAVCSPRTELLPWCQALRRLYQEECCSGEQYQRAAQDTDDVCLGHILAQISADEYRHAATLLRLLEGNMLA